MLLANEPAFAQCFGEIRAFVAKHQGLVQNSLDFPDLSVGERALLELIVPSSTIDTMQKIPNMNTSVDLSALKNRQQIAWASGDYAVIEVEFLVAQLNLLSVTKTAPCL